MDIRVCMCVANVCKAFMLRSQVFKTKRKDGLNDKPCLCFCEYDEAKKEMPEGLKMSAKKRGSDVLVST